MQKNTAGQRIDLFAFNYATGAPFTAGNATLAFWQSIDGGAVAALSNTTVLEGNATKQAGWYYALLTQGETNGNEILFTGNSSTANVTVVGRVITPTPPLWGNLSINASGEAKANLTTNSAGNLTANVTTLTAGALTAIWTNASRTLTSAANVTSTGGSIAVDENGNIEAALAGATVTEIAESVRDVNNAAPAANSLGAAVNVAGNTTAVAAAVNDEIDTRHGEGSYTTANLTGIMTSAEYTAPDNAGIASALSAAGTAASQAALAAARALAVGNGTAPVAIGNYANQGGTGASLTLGAGMTANVTGNLSGSVGSVTGAVGSVTANVTATDMHKVKAAVYDSATVSGGNITLSNGATQVVNGSGRTTTEAP